MNYSSFTGVRMANNERLNICSLLEFQVPVFKKFRSVITLVSLTGAGLLVGLFGTNLLMGLMQPQANSGIDNDSVENKILALSEEKPDAKIYFSNLPVAPSHLPASTELDQEYPTTNADSLTEQVSGGLSSPPVSQESLKSVTITRLPPLNEESVSELGSEQNLSVANPSDSNDFRPVVANSSSVNSNNSQVVGASFVVPEIPDALSLQNPLGPTIGGDVVTQLGQTTINESLTTVPANAPINRSESELLYVNPEDKLLWWKNSINAAMIPNSTLQTIETNSLVYYMLQRSPRLRAVSQNPLIREQQIVEAASEFDPVSFLQTQFQDRVDPVGDSLSITTDGSEFLDDHIWTADLGVRRKTTTGATVELNQRLGFRNSNSSFFTPQDQGTATLSLNVTQPLLRGRGRYVNQSQILIAQAATNASWDALAIELQNEIQSVVDAYWRLYFDRCVFLQKQKNVERAEIVLKKLEGRAGLDALPSQVARARSATRSRKTELANARRDIRNSETDIRRLTADSNWAASQMIELLPVELPDLQIPVADLEQVIVTALNNRPEIREAVKRSKVAAIQRNISVNELLPELSLLLGTYVSALEGESRLGDAFVDQFGSVKPGYSIGFEFEVPIGNRAARSRLNQRKLQINLIKAEIDETMQNVVAESQIARRRVVSAKETLAAALEAINAARLDMEQNEGRWEAFALVEGDIAEGQSPTIVLDRLLDSQERLAAAELVYAQAEMELKVAEVAMQRTMGTLLSHRSVNFSRGCVDDTPTVNFGSGQ